MAPSRAGMDAASYLKKQGWKGEGHSLDPTSRGIKKPLLVSKKVDVLGLGVNKHAAVSDQWWMKAFDAGLKDLGTGKKSTLQSVREHGHYAGGLYGRFVTGAALVGTFDPDEEKPTTKKRKRDNAGAEAVKKQKLEDEDARRLRKSVDRKVEGFVDEAKRRGLIPFSDSDSKPKTSRPAIALYGEDAVLRILREAGLEATAASATATEKARKYSREKQERQLKRVARPYVIGKLPIAERKQMEDYEASGSQDRKEQRKAKAAEKEQQEATRAAAKEIKALLKKEKREKKGVQRHQKQTEDATEDSTYGSDEAKGTARKADIAKYEAKVGAKGITVDEYIRRREQKKAAKAGLESGVTTASPTRDATPSEMPFIVNTSGDAALRVSSVDDSKDVFSDPDGNVRYTVVPEISVPLDPFIWKGIDVKKLPKAVREARRQCMENKRLAKKGSNDKKSQEKSKSERKTERVEKLAIKILVRSRKGVVAGNTATIDGIEGVPVVEVDKKADGPFTTDEMALARTVARRVLKEQKRQADADGKQVKRSKKRKKSKATKA